MEFLVMITRIRSYKNSVIEVAKNPLLGAISIFLLALIPLPAQTAEIYQRQSFPWNQEEHEYAVMLNEIVAFSNVDPKGAQRDLIELGKWTDGARSEALGSALIQVYRENPALFVTSLSSFNNGQLDLVKQFFSTEASDKEKAEVSSAVLSLLRDRSGK